MKEVEDVHMPTLNVHFTTVALQGEVKGTHLK